MINPPPANAVDLQDPQGRLVTVDYGWRNFFSSVFTVCSALTQSGTTAQRPTSLLWVGRTYFDTTLGYPVWLLSTGPDVWVDATGAPA